MAHRIYIYNVNSSQTEIHPTYLGEWNYVISPLLLPLFGVNLQSKRTQLYADRQGGIELLKRLYDLLTDTYHLHENLKFKQATQKMFEFLEDLPYENFQIDGTDVFNMNEESHSSQTKSWKLEIQEQIQLYLLAIETRNLAVLNPLLETFGYTSFLGLLQTDWIEYGLGYWNPNTYKYYYVETFLENNQYGLKNSKGETILPPTYQQIDTFDQGIACVEKNNKFGFINTLGKEVVPCIYDNIQFPFDIYEVTPPIDDTLEFQKASIVTIQNKQGLVAIEENQLLIPTQYEELIHIFANYFNARKNGKYKIINSAKETIIDIESETPFQFEYINLFFISQKNTNKRNYYNEKGVYLGECHESELHQLPHNHFYLKPFKPQSKITILTPNGEKLETEINQIITLSNYQTLAYNKAEKWYLYDCEKRQYLLENTEIQKVNIDYLSNYFQDLYILKTKNGNGVYHASQNNWLLPPNLEYLKIAHLRKQFLKIKVNQGIYYWDGSTQQLSPLYNYISEAINLEEVELLLYAEDTLYYLDEEANIKKATPALIGQFNNNKEYLDKIDQEQFKNFYEKWKKQIGQEYLNHFDNDTLYQLGLNLLRENNTEEAIEVFKIGANRNHSEMMTELGIIYTNEKEPQINLDLGLQLFERATTSKSKIASNNLGYHYQNGIGRKQDIKKAIEAYQNAGQWGNGLGFGNLGDLYYYGEHVEQDYEKALDYYLKAQKLKFFYSEQLTDIYFQKEEYTKVISLLKKDYDKEFSPIYYGIMYERGLGGLKTNIKKAISHYEKALTINNYPYAVQQLLFHYRPNSQYQNIQQFEKWLIYAQENKIELNYELLEISKTEQKSKKSLLNKLFKKKDK